MGLRLRERAQRQEEARHSFMSVGPYKTVKDGTNDNTASGKKGLTLDSICNTAWLDGCCTGNGEKLSSSQAEPGQAIK